MKHILDNPIYHALISGHQAFAKGTDQANYYQEDIASFAGLKDNSAADFEALYQNSPEASLFVVFTPEPTVIPENWKLLTHIDMFQMVYEPKEIPTGADADFTDLTADDVPEMTALVELTQPGPFRPRTIVLGNYTGVFKDDQLVAMAGHRFHPTPYTEVSAVCTHPDHLGKGYAYQLLREQIKRILDRSETPFLHVRNDNHGAVKLYQKLGFNIRTEMIAYVIQKIA
ncbi:GNAT family N-acetyltransferase [Pedobacter sp. Hv1]|uniref:GNAT family N-acetyltransferase n=1 Tax=Pedobacter sp. Hv1 TaxID=1740090 RepID=UPI0006D8D340|nr:GNAT family N-acetyltransferase [Pedobacter sp. Hv1]KQC00020.1 hypothetical protein AQF98_16060 [Pedobacter sp. Hv1]